MEIVGETCVFMRLKYQKIECVDIDVKEDYLWSTTRESAVLLILSVCGRSFGLGLYCYATVRLFLFPGYLMDFYW